MAKLLAIQILQEFTRVIRPLFGIAGVCRYTVTCSAYARYALSNYPLPKAIWYICKRLARCNFLFRGKQC